MTYSVSPRVKPITFGPKPMEKRGTSMSTHFAVMKWPSSCTKMSTPSTTMVARIVVSISSSRPRGDLTGLPVGGQHGLQRIGGARLVRVQRAFDDVGNAGERTAPARKRPRRPRWPH
jgi:hypothetical protein